MKEKQLVTETEILWNLRKHRKIKMAKVWKNRKVRTENRDRAKQKREAKSKNNLIYYYRNETKKRMWNKRKQSKLVIKTKQNRRVLILKITYENNTSITYITLKKTTVSRRKKTKNIWAKQKKRWNTRKTWKQVEKFCKKVCKHSKLIGIQ